MAYIIYVLPAKILKRFESRLVQFGSSFIQTYFFEKKIVFFDKKTSFPPLFQFISHIVRTMGDIVVQLKIYCRTTIECIVVQLKGV